MILTRLYEKRDRARWQAYVAGAAGATLYHDLRWKDVLERSFGHRCPYLLALDERNEVRGVLPVAQLRSLLFGNFLVSLPFVNYGGLCGDPAARSHLLEAAADLARDLGASHIELRHLEPACGGLPVKAEKVSMRLALPDTPDELWRRLSAKVRSQVRRPEKAGITATIGRLELLDAFYRVFAENMRDLGTPVYAKRFFEEILEAFPEQSWLCAAFHGGEPVAAGLLVGFRESLEIPWASSLRRMNPLSPNMLLYWTALRFAVERRFRVFDFGRSTPGEGTFRFKEQWDAYPVPLYWHYWLRSPQPLPELNPRNPRYRLAIRLWRRLPVAVTRAVGPALVRNLP